MADQEPEVLELFGELAGDFKERFASYFVGGLGIGLITMPVTVVAVLLVYGAAFGGMLPGMMVDDEALILGGLFAGLSVSALLATALMVGVLAPLQASLARAMVRHFEGEEELSLGAPFSTATEGLGRLYAYTALHSVVGLVGMLFCYLPGIAWQVLTHFAWCRVVLDDEAPVDALRHSVADVREQPLWHLTYAFLLVVVVVLVSYLPLIGAFLAPSVTIGIQVYAYRRKVHGRPAISA